MNPPREDSVRRAESEIRDVIVHSSDGVDCALMAKQFINRAWTEYLGLSLRVFLALVGRKRFTRIP